MCGRFSVTGSKEDIESRFNVIFNDDDFKSVYNAAPTQSLPIINNTEPSLVRYFKWGLIPYWAKDSSIASKMINARAETIFEKPTFKNLVTRKRCLVISDGFYEWKQLPGGKKQPYRISLNNNDLFAFAGLWDEWKDLSGKKINTFTIITTHPNDLMADIHNRMPVILKMQDEKTWLSNNSGIKQITDLLCPYPSELMNAYPLSTLVNSPANNDERILLPLQ